MIVNKIAYVQKQNSDWLNEDCYLVAKGLNRMMYEVTTFTDANSIQVLGKNTDMIVYGGINTMRKVFDIVKVKQPEIHNPHTHLPEYINRKMGETQLKNIRNGEIGFPIFIKPLYEHKLFTGYVVKSTVDLLKINSISDEADILYSECINMVSEYRCFIHREKLVGCKNYTGDYTVLPDFHIVNDAISMYSQQPVSYSLDFGITDTGHTVLIEINDGFGLGMYGFNHILYCKMMIDRWNEICQYSLTGKISLS